MRRRVLRVLVGLAAVTISAVIVIALTVPGGVPLLGRNLRTGWFNDYPTAESVFLAVVLVVAVAGHVAWRRRQHDKRQR